MPTRNDTTRIRATRATLRPLRRTRFVRSWPILLPLALLALLAARLVSGGANPEARPTATTSTRLGAAASQVGTREFAGLKLDVPTSWTTLERTADHIAWGSADRSHTVTLAAAESSSLPLPGVVGAVSSDSADAVPGTRPIGRPLPLDLDAHAPHGDAAVLARFAVDPGNGAELEIRQVWRRDTRAGMDVVATWTSSDGQWPASPSTLIPRAEASR